MDANMSLIDIFGPMPEIKFMPPKITVELKTKKFLWLRWRVPEYYIQWEFCRSGPYKKYADAYYFYSLALRAYD